jgi:hypothetical protein
MAIFTSPLRRAVGTLLALETVLNDDAAVPIPITSTTVQVDPSQDRSQDRTAADQSCRRKLFDGDNNNDINGNEKGRDLEQGRKDEASKPVTNDATNGSVSATDAAAPDAILTTSTPPTKAVILNGLCDCAAQVAAWEGAGRILRTWPWLLSCADAPVQRSTRTLGPQLDLMRSDRNQSCPPKRHLGQPATIQFCRVDTCSMRLEPMHEDSPPHTDDLVTNDSVPYDSFLRAVNRAVTVASANNDKCDTVVIVGHREGIRDLARESCRTKSTVAGGDRNGHTKADPHRIHTFYCCIAVFTVDLITDVDDGDAASAAPRVENWTFHGCHDYQSFDATCLPP